MYIMKKILILLTVLIMCVSCVDVYRANDCFVVYSKSMTETSYKYKYKAYHIMIDVSNGDEYYVSDCCLFSNDNYELGDTIRLVKSDN